MEPGYYWATNTVNFIREVVEVAHEDDEIKVFAAGISGSYSLSDYTDFDRITDPRERTGEEASK